MKIEGSADIPAPRDAVWAAFLDPNILAQALPGCEKLEAIGPNEYRATMKVGVAAIKGTFEGKVKLSDLEPPNRYRMAVEGSGGPGFVRGEASMQMSDVDGGTKVSYDADVQVGGLIASVGQRMLGGVTKMMLDQFFTKMTELLTSKPA
jgi:carbon monoxide dehydrogenase subunit G